MPLWHESFGEWSGLQRELGRVLDAARETIDSVVGHFTWPAVNTFETPEEFIVAAEAPGMDANSFEVSVANQTLFIRASRPPLARPEGSRLTRNERAEGRFERAIVLAPTLDPVNVSARYDRGVLVVRVPKVAAARPRKIIIEEA